MTDIMSRCKWKLWFLTVTLTLVYLQLFSCNFSEVGAVTIPISVLDEISSNGRNTISEDGTETPSPSTGKSTNDLQDTVTTTVKSPLKIKTINTKRNSIGYAAEWEYTGNVEREEELLNDPPKTDKEQSKIEHVPFTTYPTRRLGPGSWLDSKGYWWVFGGLAAASVTSDINKTSSPTHYLSDLWVYGPPAVSLLEKTTGENYWRNVYRPENSGESPLSSHPEVLFPTLCGSEKSGHLSLFRGQTSESLKSPSGIKETHNSLFTEDNVVWLYDIPKTFEKIPRRTIKSQGSSCNWSKKDGQRQGRLCNETEGLLWTSYICCDACLPDGNTMPDFTCPEFSGTEPILWCNQDSLLAFQLTINSTDPAVQSEKASSFTNVQGKQTNSSASSKSLAGNLEKESQQRNITEVGSSSFTGDVTTKVGKSPFPVSHISQNSTAQDSMINGSNSQGVGQPEREVRQRIAAGENEKKPVTMSKTWANGKSGKQQEPVQTRMEEMKRKMNNKELNKEINIPKVSESTTTSTLALPTVEQQQHYTQEKRKLTVNWWKFDLTLTEWMKLPEVNINTADYEHISRGNCRSVSDKELLYILCPSTLNLLDRTVYVFDPSKGQIKNIGQIHLNSAFHDKKLFRASRSILDALKISNKATILFLAYQNLLDLFIHDYESNKLFAVENVWKASSLERFQRTKGFYKLSIVLPLDNSELADSQNSEKKTHTFYMVNPRSRLFKFDDPFPDGYFQITIVPDSLVFLPSRDAPYLENQTEIPYKSQKTQENNALNDTIDYPNVDLVKTTITSFTEPSADIQKGTQTENKFTQEGKLFKHYGMAKSKFPEETVDGLRKSDGLGETFNQPTSQSPFTRRTSEKMYSGSVHDTIPNLSSQSNTISPSGLLKKSNNKTNNSQLRVEEVVPVSKNKRILGIKRSESPESFKKMDVEPQQLASGSRISSSNDSQNTIMSKGSLSSLPVNNESNRKPLSTSSESPANSKDMPEVMKVLKRNSSRVTSEKKRDDPSPSTKLRNKSSTSSRTTIQEAKSAREVNLSVGPEASALKVASMQLEPQYQHHSRPQFESLPGNLGIKTDQPKIWKLPNNNSSSSAYNFSSKKQAITADENHNQANLESNYVFSRSKLESSSVAQKQTQKNHTFLTHSYNETFMGDMDRETHLTYGSSEIVIDSSNNEIHSINQDDVDSSSYSSYSTFGSILFFSLSLSIFASFGFVIFVRRCVKCPTQNESVLLKEPPPIRYSVIHDDILHEHTPIV